MIAQVRHKKGIIIGSRMSVYMYTFIRVYMYTDAYVGRVELAKPDNYPTVGALWKRAELSEPGFAGLSDFQDYLDDECYFSISAFLLDARFCFSLEKVFS